MIARVSALAVMGSNNGGGQQWPIVCTAGLATASTIRPVRRRYQAKKRPKHLCIGARGTTRVGLAARSRPKPTPPSLSAISTESRRWRRRRTGSHFSAPLTSRIWTSKICPSTIWTTRTTRIRSGGVPSSFLVTHPSHNTLDSSGVFFIQ